MSPERLRSYIIYHNDCIVSFTCYDRYKRDLKLTPIVGAICSHYLIFLELSFVVKFFKIFNRLSAIFKCKRCLIIIISTGWSRACLSYKHFLTCSHCYHAFESMGGTCLSRSHILQVAPLFLLTVTTKQIRKRGAFTRLSGAN